MKSMKKILTMMGVIALTAAIAIGGTLAYLTSTAEVKNTFTVGKVAIDMDETDVNLYGVKDGETRVKENAYKLMPSHPYIKDPTITIDAQSEESYLFVKVENGISTLESKAADYKSIEQQMIDNGWVKVTGTTENTVPNGVYKLNRTVKGGDSAVTVFSSFTIDKDADLSIYSGTNAQPYPEVKITAYAIQADGLSAMTDAQIWNLF